MARIDLDKPYITFLESQVEAGLYATVSEAARDAIRKQMEFYESRRIASIHAELAKGEASILAGRVVEYREGLMAEISKKGKEQALQRKEVKNEIKP